MINLVRFAIALNLVLTTYLVLRPPIKEVQIVEDDAWKNMTFILIQEKTEIELSLLAHANALYKEREDLFNYRVMYDPNLPGASQQDLQNYIYGRID